MFYYTSTTSRRYPAPAIQIIVQSTRDPLLRHNIEAILDTGSTPTCVPDQIIQLIGGDTLPYDIKKVIGATGQVEQLKRYVVNLKIGQCSFDKVYVVAIPRPYALIGRDLANNHIIQLDGRPNARIWSMDPC